MRDLTFQHIVLGILFASVGTIGGWAITGKLAGDVAALSFLQFGSVVVIAMFFVQTLLFSWRNKRLLYLLIFNVAFCCSIIWFMLCLILPILWVGSIAEGVKVSFFLLLITLSASNIIQANLQFKRKWVEQEGTNLIWQCNDNKGVLDWKKIIEGLKFSITLYIPGMPKSMNPVISLMLISSMLTGLATRNVFPMTSLFAWGVPVCVAIATLMQMIGLGIAQIMKVKELEKRFGMNIVSIA